MEGAILIHQSQMEIHGDKYHICVYCRDDGRHFAKTHLGGDDVVINDGSSLDEVLERHCNILPLAVGSRKIRDEARRVIRKGMECHA